VGTEEVAGEMKTREEKLAYQRGYNRGVNCGKDNKWPDHIPPTPPDPVVGKMVEALKQLRMQYDWLCATFGPDDEIVTHLDPYISIADDALADLSQFVREQIA
jgi:hypothetical protein